MVIENKHLTKQQEQAKLAVSGWHLGDTSKKYESFGGDPGTISTGKGDLGGVSYGVYQLSTNLKTIDEYLKDTNNYNGAFDGLTPNTAEFNSKWKHVAKTDRVNFSKSQHEFILKTHFNILCTNIKKHLHFDPREHSKALQDAVLSTAVQFGGYTHLFQNAQSKSGINFSSASDEQIINSVYDYKINNSVDTVVDVKVIKHGLFKSSSHKMQLGAKHRFEQEKPDLLKLLHQEEIVKKLKEQQSTHAEANQPLSPLAESLRGQIENLCRTEVGKLGFKWDGGMDNTVYALTAEALKNGFKQATHLALNDGIIDLGDLSVDRNLLAALDSNIAAQTPVENSLKNISVITQNQAQAEQQKQTQQETQQQTPSKAPHMSA